MNKNKSAYICGPLTELVPPDKERAMRLYEKIADLCEEVFGVRGFVPHEHYDPIKNANFTPQEVDSAERDQVMNNSSHMIVVALAPSWGGGIEVEMANQVSIPIIILCEKQKLEEKKISRLLRGNPAVHGVVTFDAEKDALQALKNELEQIR